MASNDKEFQSKNEIENYESGDYVLVKSKMRRRKPHQQIYTPGSGPLRKRIQEEGNESDTSLSMESRNVHMNDNVVHPKHNRNRGDKSIRNRNINNESENMDKKRNKKPEQPLYVPKPIAQAMAVRENNYTSNNDETAANQNEMNVEQKNRVRSNRSYRNGNLHRDDNVDYSKGPNHPKSRRPGGSHRQMDRRDMRQDFEAPYIGNRTRDTRSVEPAANTTVREKVQIKPPSGRRHSTIGLESKPKSTSFFDSLPPRLKKKYLDERNLDGGSYMTFQNSNSSNYPISTQACLHYNQTEPQERHIPSPSWSNTIPNTRVRGRGRLRPDEIDHELLRSVTPDRVLLASPVNSRPCTPTAFPTRSGRGRYRSDDHDVTNAFHNRVTILSPSSSRPCTPPFVHRVGMDPAGRPQGGFVRPVVASPVVTSCATQSVVTPSTSVVSTSVSVLSSSNSNVSSTDTVSSSKISSKTLKDDDEAFDWNEEVEMQERMEAEHLSDSLTRASSVVSLVENAPQQSHHKSRSSKRRNKNRSLSQNSKREKSIDNQNNNNQNRPMVYENDNHGRSKHHRRGRDREKDSRDNRGKNHGKDLGRNRDQKDKRDDVFKVPAEPKQRRPRHNSFRDRSHDKMRPGKSQNNSRHSSMERIRRDSINDDMNWRDEIRQRCDAERRTTGDNTRDWRDSNGPAPGILILPQNVPDRSKPPVLPDNSHGQVQRKAVMPQRTLYDPKNPSKPVIVNASNSRLPPENLGGYSNVPETSLPDLSALHITDSFGNVRPAWYDVYGSNFRECHFPYHLLDVQKADMDLQCIVNSGGLLRSWNNEVATLRKYFQDSLEFLLVKDIKFCEKENVENHYWKIMFYNIIELMRKSIANDPKNKEQYRMIILSLIAEGTKYFERLLNSLEEAYRFKLDNYLGSHGSTSNAKESKFVGLALVSAQKIYLFLGDLARYKEQVNETSNYGICKQWYIKAQEINPKNGRPYNQLALLAVYARRKLDAVYYYMRSLMSSNPVQSARESLISLFDENRKKYEQSEKKRREERAKLHMKEKESSKSNIGSLRREIWVHPEGGRRLHRTTAAQDNSVDSEEEDLSVLSSIDINKRFVTSYLHVHGKLITKIGMETFQEAAVQMLREFRVLLQHSPVPLTTTRFLQLLALNMFAIGSTQLKDPQLEPRCRSELQERALVVSLQMFSVILGRCVALLEEQVTRGPGAVISQDLCVVLPAVKVWCDWMLCHSSIWNPPPSFADYRTGPPGSPDAWARLAILMNLLEKLDLSSGPRLESSPSDNPSSPRDLVRLPEDVTMCGFTPLMHNIQEPAWVDARADPESAHTCLRVSRILFFGTEFLCGLEPPVLKLQRYETCSEYVSVVQESSRASPTIPVHDLLVESFSEDEEEVKQYGDAGLQQESVGGDIKDLIDRKVELERKHRNQELHRQYTQAILQQSVVSVEVEIRPRYLVPDTNCFIDHLEVLQLLGRDHGPYVLMVPLVVIGELEGLARGGKTPAPAGRAGLDPEHLVRVAAASKQALEYLRSRPSTSVKCVTTRGTVMKSASFTVEDDRDHAAAGPCNDDRILATCLSLCKPAEAAPSGDGPRRIQRDLVLLTDDRNLRVKALARDVPVRELPDFARWNGMG